MQRWIHTDLMENFQIECILPNEQIKYTQYQEKCMVNKLTIHFSVSDLLTSKYLHRVVITIQNTG